MAQLSERIKKLNTQKKATDRRVRRKKTTLEQKIKKSGKNDTHDATVTLFNLAPSTTSSGLRVQLSEFQIKDVSINCNQNGKSIGTGSLAISKNQATRLIQKCSGMVLKGKELGFKLTEKPKIGKRVRFNDENATFPSKNILAAPRKSNPSLNRTEKLVKKLSARNLSDEVLSFTFNNLSV
ncbi:hypothetical protein GCK72_013333 [Caenorhabditis remanei]|uniref:RRM domain-containing protein n=1 Tax=Caenorhabditis remanei TaxID=31234 RepID=A0A6A5GQY4_CAERE|nr:hypothetical protein GCK72_013333 [Caenorhabditis remanei]KAF1756879.1 hypothetical protein GCK72_013333 [Caenorhabditis remanei]